jgi:hypothetical protein
MKQNAFFKQLKKLIFITLFFPFFTHSQVTIDFNNLPYNDDQNITKTVDIEGFRFTINSTDNDQIQYDTNQNPSNSPALFDNNRDVGDITEWKIEKIDGVNFQLRSVYLQNSNFGSPSGTITAYKDDAVVGSAAAITFNGTTTLSSNPDFNNIDEIRINATDINFFVDDVIYVINNTWTGSTDNNWDTASNWSTSSVPVSSTNVTIPAGLTNYPTAGSALTFNSLTINSGASMIAQSTVVGNVTYNLAIPDTNWHLVSSPVVGETYDDAWIAANAIASGTGNNRGISTYDNGTPDVTTLHWRYSQAGSTAAFTAGGGYANKRTATGTYSFTGTFPTQQGVLPAISQNNKNYNLIGNPYPSYLDIAAFIAANTANMTPTHQAVYVWNGTTYTNLTTGHIHPGQGFFISSNVPTGNASITEDMQSHNTGSFYRTNNPTINLTLSNGVSFKETTINYLDGKTIGLDPRFDIGMFKGVASDLSVFTHLIEGHQEVAFETQALPNTDLESMIVPMGVKVNANEEITFSLNASNFTSDLKIFLEDSITSTYTRLDEANSTYTITTTEALTGIGRFYLHTSRSSLDVKDIALENVSVFKSDANTLRIVGLQNNSKTNVTLFDLTGKQLLNTSFKSNGVKDIAIPKLASGIYVVKLKTDTHKFSKKIILE